MKNSILTFSLLMLCLVAFAHDENDNKSVPNQPDCADQVSADAVILEFNSEVKGTRYKWCCFHSSHRTLRLDACTSTSTYYSSKEACWSRKRSHQSSTGHNSTTCFRI